MSKDRSQTELAIDLDKLLEIGAVGVAFPKPTNGAGFPVRVFAIVP